MSESAIEDRAFLAACDAVEDDLRRFFKLAAIASGENRPYLNDAALRVMVRGERGIVVTVIQAIAKIVGSSAEEGK